MPGRPLTGSQPTSMMVTSIVPAKLMSTRLLRKTFAEPLVLPISFRNDAFPETHLYLLHSFHDNDRPFRAALRGLGR